MQGSRVLAVAALTLAGWLLTPAHAMARSNWSIEILSSLRLQETGVAAVYGVLLMLLSAAAFLAWGEEKTA